eukprot:TRINITY_DN10145_c0_g1_i1.p1 TRINITY_DN10145_c0_g1~~TRINITY_DN10145_c0_g1_i1.p1  ORF type:complete len:377 (+),score=100.29 TRINITY_DN10145_c0_g1_i1:52-1182(+)
MKALLSRIMSDDGIKVSPSSSPDFKTIGRSSKDSPKSSPKNEIKTDDDKIPETNKIQTESEPINIKNSGDSDLRRREDEERRKEEDERKKREDEERKKEESRLRNEVERLQRIEEMRKQQDQDRKKRTETEREHKLIKKTTQFKTMSGFLSKKGHKRRNWKVRFFAVEFIDRAIKYYKSDKMDKLKGVIEFDDLKSVNEYENRTDRLHTFSIILKSGKVYSMAAGSQKERNKWITTVNYLISGNPGSPDTDEPRSSIINAISVRYPMEGFLFRKGDLSVSSGFSKFYFKLEASLGTDSISYFEEQDDKEERGSIPIKNAVISRCEGPKEFMFSVTTMKNNGQTRRETVFAAMSQDDMKKWIRALNAAVICLKEELM